MLVEDLLQFVDLFGGELGAEAPLKGPVPAGLAALLHGGTLKQAGLAALLHGGTLRQAGLALIPRGVPTDFRN